MLKIIYFLVAVAVIAGVAGMWFSQKPAAISNPAVIPENPDKLCTMDAMQCSDGTYVGRTGANCEFVCPDGSTSTSPVGSLPNGISVTAPIANTVLSTSTVVTGTADGSWYFEGSFGVLLLDGNNNQIALAPATAQGDWMTTSTVPFSASLEFTNPYHPGDPESLKIGTLELHNDNPSGLPQNDKKIQIPVRFAP
jgi:Immunoglobulin-like domain of bacterial spore germination